MILTKRLLLGIVAAGLAGIPASATPITWNFGGTDGGKAGFTLTDGTLISGSFTYDVDISTANCQPGCTTSPYGNTSATAQQPADYNGLQGLFGTGINGSGAQTGTQGGVTGSFTVTPGDGSFLPTGLTWYINTNVFDTVSVNSADCCADNLDTWLVSANPATTADMTDLNYNPSNPLCTTDPGDNASICTDTPYSDAAYGIQIFLSNPMTDSGSLYPTGDVISSVLAGVCSDYACGDDYAGGDAQTATLADSKANVNTGDVPQTGTPEPSTLLLGASALAIGAFRRRFFTFLK